MSRIQWFLAALMICWTSAWAQETRPATIGRDELALRLGRAAEYEYIVTDAAIGLSATLHYAAQRPGQPATRAADDGQSGPGLREAMLKLAFDQTPRKGLSVQIAFADGAVSPAFYARDDCMAVHAARWLLPEGTRDQWMKKLAPAADDVRDLSQLEAVPAAGLVEMPENDPAAQAVIKLAKPEYDRRRPALARRFSGSYLAYPPADKTFWVAWRQGEAVWARTGCADLMYVASFWFKYEKDAGGNWRLAETCGGEAFKGE